MAVMKPFELTFKLGSNLTLRNKVLHLDGLLSNVCYRHIGCPEKALTMLDDLLLFNPEHRMYHASAMAFGVTGEQGIIACSRYYVGNLKHGKQLRDDLILPTKTTGKGEQYRKINIQGGPEKNRLNKHQAYYSPYIIFHGVGDVDKIDKLVQFHCSRIGSNAGSGSGTVDSIRVREIEADFSFVDAHGQIAKNLPLSWIEQSNQKLNFARTEQLPIKAPYWQSHHKFSTSEAVAVEKIRRVVVRN